MTHLYEVAFKLREVTGQSAVARLLNESPQTVKNWETRGISQRGAIKAQEILGIDANYLLALSQGVYEIPVTEPVKVSEIQRAWGWPFKEVKPAQYDLLSNEEKKHVEDGILLIVKARDTSEKKASPAYYKAHHQ